MPDRTLLYLTDDAGTHLQLWRQQGDTAPQRLAMGGWDESAVTTALNAVAERGESLWVVMPAVWGSLLQVPIPSRRREQALQALPFAIEDLVVDDVEDLHLTLGGEPVRIDDGLLWPVLVVNAARRRMLLEQLEKHGIRPQGLLHPLDLWPLPETNQWHAFLTEESGSLSVVTGAHAGFVLPLPEGTRHPTEVLTAVLPQMQESMARPEVIIGHGWGDDVGAKVEDATAFSAAELRIESRPAVDWPASWFAAITRNRPLSAIEPAGAGRRRVQRRQWAWVAVLLAMIGMTMTAERAISGWQAAAQSRQLQAQISRDFHAALPNVKRLVNARVQLKQALAAVSGGGRHDGFLMAMTALSQGLKQARSKDHSLRLRQVSFRQGRLVADLQGGQYEAMQQLYGQLQQQGGLSVKRLDSGVEAGKAHMRLEIAADNTGEQG